TNRTFTTKLYPLQYNYCIFCRTKQSDKINKEIEGHNIQYSNNSSIDMFN
ncbi:hypothetical protein GYH30_057125, partial [Glycine max]